MDKYVVPDILKVNDILLAYLILDETYEEKCSKNYKSHDLKVAYKWTLRDSDYKLTLVYEVREYPNYRDYYDLKTNEKYQTVYNYYLPTGRMLIDTDFSICTIDFCNYICANKDLGETITKEEALKIFEQYVNKLNQYNNEQNIQDGENKDKQKIIQK